MTDKTDHNREEFRGSIERFWSGEVEWDVPLSKLTTLQTGGSAWAVIRPESMAEAENLARGCVESGLRWVCIGGGSNVLASDEGFSGVVISLGRKMSKIRKSGQDSSGKHLVEVEAGCSLVSLLKWCMDKGLSGLEFAAGIPGTLGGAVAMNAGAWGKEMKDVIASICWFDGRAIIKSTRKDLRFTYRRWMVEQPALVLSVKITLEEGNQEDIKMLCSKYVSERKSKQPSGPSAGSFFRNPGSAPAGKLIQDSGLKGVRVGGAVISQVHANFIVNSGGASSDDILRLMEKVQDKVLEDSGERLLPEVRILGKLGFDQ